MTVTFTTGVMGAGKSKLLIEKIIKDNTTNVAISAHLDKETGELGKIESRNGQSIYSIILNVNDHFETLKYVDNLFSIHGIETVYVDEVQFFKKETISGILELAAKYNIDVHFFGLETSFTGAYFEASLFLLDVIDDDQITRIPMICQSDDCNFVAKFNARISNGKVVRHGETFVSAKSKYLSLCQNHYLE